MDEYIKKYNLRAALLIFIVLPILFLVLGDFPWRTVFKESLSIIFILTFFLMIGLFFITRGNDSVVKSFGMSNLIKYHKYIGYFCVSVFLIHPFLLVVPRYFESGIDPTEAFFTIITTFESRGVVLGIIAWCLMLILGITSFLRNRLPMKYTTWRYFHGVLVMLFILLATWHMVDLGRHTDLIMSIYVIILAVSGISLLLKTYILKPVKANRIVL